MNSKQYVIEKVEKLLKNEELELDKCRQNRKMYKAEIAIIEAKTMEAISGIAGLKDALHKLKGLDNLEKKNKIADRDPGRSAHPDYVISQKGDKIAIPELYDKLKKEAERRGE